VQVGPGQLIGALRRGAQVKQGVVDVQLRLGAGGGWGGGEGWVR